MTAMLRWKASKWEKAPLMCRLFGHVWERGWWGDTPYLRAKNLPGYEDGIGRRHIDLVCKCSRCDTQTTMARVHNWAPAEETTHVVLSGL